MYNIIIFYSTSSLRGINFLIMRFYFQFLNKIGVEFIEVHVKRSIHISLKSFNF